MAGNRLRGAVAVAAAVTIVSTGVAVAEPATAPLDWTGCGDGLDCATLEVPLDYADPEGPTVSLKLTRRQAGDPERRIGVLVANPGGPGGRTDRMPDRLAEASAELAARFDIIGMDPRGVGGSTPSIACQDTASYARQWGQAKALRTPGQYDRAMRLAREYVAACDRASADLLPHVGTANVARDLDTLRAALGERQLSYFGLSYGTYIGTVYANMFPDRVRAAVLDGGYDARRFANDPYPADLVQFEAADRALSRFFGWCESAPAACGFGDGRPAEAFRRLQAELDAEPVRGPDGTVLANGATMVLRVVISLNRGRPGWPELGAALAEAAQRRTGAALEPIGDGDTTFYAANVSVECADRAYPETTRGLRRQLVLGSVAGRHLGTAFAYGPPGYDHSHAPACHQWPAAQESRYAGPFDVPTENPLLVVGTRHDPDTPYADSVALARTLGNAHLLTFEGDGHTGFGRSPCVRAAEARYLLDRTLPARDCTDNPPPSS